MYAQRNINQKRSSRYPSVVKLNASNFREWREDLHTAAIQFDQAGKTLRSGVIPNYREPGRDE